MRNRPGPLFKNFSKKSTRQHSPKLFGNFSYQHNNNLKHIRADANTLFVLYSNVLMKVWKYHHLKPIAPLSQKILSIYHRILSRGRLLSKFQRNRSRGFVLNACGSGCVQKNKNKKISWKIRKMEKEQHRWMIRFLLLDTVYGDSSLRWRPSKMYLIGSIFNRPGVSKTLSMENNVTKVHDLILADRRTKGGKIAEIVGISKDCMGHIPH